jgi:phosphoribosylglycinamide formyltransferase 2
MKKILLLGSGELGKELTISLQRFGCFIIACDKYKNAPAMQVSQECEVFDMLNSNNLKQVIDKHKPDLIVPEIEAIDTESLIRFERKGLKVIPSSRAVSMTMNRDQIRNRAKELGIKTARFGYAENLKELIEMFHNINAKVAIKPVMSSSGKGQSYASTVSEVKKAWNFALNGMRGKKKKVIIEEFINFDYEVTLLTILDSEGKIHFCPPIGHVQERGDYQHSWQPAKCEQNIVNKMKIIARKIVKDLNGKGLFGIEFFIKKDEVYFSELSPRPHDTGMVTMFTQNFSEFDLHARAILDFTIPKIELVKKGVSQVILANKNAKGKFLIKGIEYAFKDKTIDIRIFGKPETKPYRRMGVILASNLKKAKEALSKINVVNM